MRFYRCLLEFRTACDVVPTVVKWSGLLAGLELLQVLPPDIREPLVQHNNRAYLLEVSSASMALLQHRCSPVPSECRVCRSFWTWEEGLRHGFLVPKEASISGTLRLVEWKY